MIALYARQSLEKKDSISLESQIDFARREAFGEECRVYQDSGFSGKNTNRPAFTRMMEDIERDEITKVIVYRLDRISRSILDFADFMNYLDTKNVAFVSATEKFDTSTPMGRAMLYIVVVFAQLERETLAERVKDNYYARVKKGAWGGGPAAFGFDLIKTTIGGKKATMLQPNDNIETVKLIFKLYCDPLTSLADVHRELIAAGISTPAGVSFTGAKLSLILKNPSYVRADTAVYNYYKSKGVIMANEAEDFDGIHGCILVGKRAANERKYTNVSEHLLAMTHHEGIIDSADFLYIQQKLARNAQIKNTYKGKHSWLTGLVKCGHCGYAFSVRISKTKDGPVPYLVCSGKYLYHTCDARQTHRLREVEEVILQEMIERSQQYPLQQEENKSADHHADLQKKIFDLDAKIENLIMSLESASDVSVAYINQRVEKIHLEKKELELQLSDADLPHQRIHVAPFTKSDWENLSFEEQKRIARSMLKKVTLSEEGVHIDFS